MRGMTDDDGLTILNDIAANPTLPLDTQIEAKAAADACAERGIRTCAGVIALLIGVLAQTRGPKEARH